MCNPSLTFCDVEVEEVTVEDSLNTASHHSNKVKESFKIVAVGPVQDVEGTVGSYGETVFLLKYNAFQMFITFSNDVKALFKKI